LIADRAARAFDPACSTGRRQGPGRRTTLGPVIDDRGGFGYLGGDASIDVVHLEDVRSTSMGAEEL